MAVARNRGGFWPRATLICSFPAWVLGMEWWLAASGGHGSGRPLMVLVPADGVWLLMEMQRGKVGCRIGCRPEDYEGWVKTRLWPWPEPVTVVYVDAVTFLKASTGCSLFLCEGQLRGKPQDLEGRSLAACWRRFPLEGIDFGVQSGQRDQLVCWEVGGMHWCGIEASVATTTGQVKSETLQW